MEKEIDLLEALARLDRARRRDPGHHHPPEGRAGTPHHPIPGEPGPAPDSRPGAPGPHHPPEGGPRPPADVRHHGGMHGHGAGRLLQVLAAHDGASAGGLSALLEIRAPSVTEHLERLETAGAIRREKDPADARVTRAYLTVAGRAELARHDDRLRAENDRLAACLSPAEQQEFIRLCTKLADGLARRPAEREG